MNYTEEVFLKRVKNNEYGEDFRSYELHGAIVPISDHVIDFYKNEFIGMSGLEKETRLPEWVKTMLLTKKQNKTLRMLFAAGDFVKEHDGTYKTNIEQYPDYDIYVSWPEPYSDRNSGTPETLSVMANFDFLYRNFFQQKIMIFMDVSRESHMMRFLNLCRDSLELFASLEQRIVNERLVWPLLRVGGLWERGGSPPKGFIKNIESDKSLFKKVNLQGGTRTRTYKNNKLHSQRKTQTRKQFYFNPEHPTKSFNVYINKNPKDTIPIQYKSVNDVKHTIQKLERLYKNKKYSHKRIWQVGMIMKVRLEVLKAKKPKEYALANRYFEFLSKRTDLPDEQRYKTTFKL